MNRVRVAVAVVCLGSATVGAVTACSGGTTTPSNNAAASNTGTGGSSIDPGANDTKATPPSVCTNIDAIKILFQPAYSGFDGQNHYKVPAVVDGIDPSVIVWTTSDDSLVTHTPDNSFGGEMFETKGAGEVTIFAAAGNLCGHSVLRITADTVALWQAGSSRYNNGVVANRSVTRPRFDAGATDSPPDVACTNCHGTTGTLGTVEHTPMQTAGYSDSDLKGIFMNGVTPNGQLAQPITNLTYAQWSSFHKWQMADDNEANGVVAYLRALEPTPTGNADFGGAFGPGGRGPRGDGGFGRGPDGGP